jgi:hypothetical protein
MYSHGTHKRNHDLGIPRSRFGLIAVCFFCHTITYVRSGGIPCKLFRSYLGAKMFPGCHEGMFYVRLIVFMCECMYVCLKTFRALCFDPAQNFVAISLT